MRKEDLENLIFIGRKEGQGKAIHNILNGLEKVDGRTGSGEISNRQNLRAYKGQEEVECHHRLHPEETQHIKEEE